MILVSFELDFSLQSGLGKLNDDGDFEKLTITIQIECRRAGSDDEYTVIEKSWTNSTNDQLAETIRLELDAADNYEQTTMSSGFSEPQRRTAQPVLSRKSNGPYLKASSAPLTGMTT